MLCRRLVWPRGKKNSRPRKIIFLHVGLVSSYWFSPTESNFYRATLHTAVYATARCSSVRHKLRRSIEWLNGSSTGAIRSPYPALCCKGIGVSPKNKGTSQSSLWKFVPNSELSRCFWFVAIIRPPSQVLSTSFNHRKFIIFCAHLCLRQSGRDSERYARFVCDSWDLWYWLMALVC